MLSKSRAADSGLKLEVNEKILDSCTTLMQAIRVLVQKSRLLQAEIVAQGKVSSMFVCKLAQMHSFLSFLCLVGGGEGAW